MSEPLGDIISFLKQRDELEAGKALLKVFDKYSTSIQQLDQLGMYYNEMKDYHSAIKCAQNIMVATTDPRQLYSTRANLAKLYNHINEPERSLWYSQYNLKESNGQDYEAKMEMIFAHYLMGDRVTSRQLIDDIIADVNSPDDVRLRCEFNLGSYLMDDGDFKQGLLNFIDVGHAVGIWPKYDFPIPQWNGEIIPGATIAIVAEGGIGDEVINIRFAKNIVDLGMRPVFVTSRKDTAEIFWRNGFGVAHHMHDFSLSGPNTYGIKSMYLPIALGLDKDELWTRPYLKPDPKYVAKWEKIFEEYEINDKKRVAIRWAGNKYYDQDLHRTVPVERYNDVLNFDRTDVTFVSVQKDDYYDHPNVFNAASFLDNLEDLLACLSLVDYTVSSCTSVAHICAAAGFPITVCPPMATYYTWLGDAKWYGDNCKILRQTKWKDWSHLDQLKEHIG